MTEEPAVRHPERGSVRIPGITTRRSDDAAAREMWRGFGEAWTVLSTIITGVAVWGAIGYGLDRLFGTWPVLFVTGALVGNFAAIYLVYLRTMREPDHAA